MPETKVVVVWNLVTQGPLITQETDDSDADTSPHPSRDTPSDRSEAR
jgi:hypothetical protein